MKTNNFFSLCAAVSLLAVGCSNAEDNKSGAPQQQQPQQQQQQQQQQPQQGLPMATPTQKGSLANAHQAYLDGDFTLLGERVRDVLLDPNSNDLVKENAYALLDKAFETQKGTLPSSFKPQPGVTHLQLAYRRFMSPHGPTYQIRFAGLTKDASQIANLTVRRLPNEVLMDKATGVGKFSIRHDPSAVSRGAEEFVIDSPLLETLSGDGVISLRLELADGSVSEGFVIAHALTPSTSPEVLSPTTSSSTTDANPLVKWAPFRSPEYAPFESRRTVIHVTRDRESASLWELSTPKATSTDEDISEVRIGSGGNPKNASLTPGNYWVSVGTSEARFFGPVEVLRASRITLPFNVVR